MIHSSEVLIGVAFLDGKFFRIKQMIKTTIKTESEFEVENIARDIDCIYVSEYRRIVCSFGFLSNGIYECGLNVFTSSITQNEFKNNFKQFDCKNHYSRKLRLNSNINEDTNFFYYYFVGSNNIAYISKVVVKSASIIEPGNVIEILRGCSQEQHSFDLAEDKFLGYNVFTCVDSQFRTKIKIQLFKLENGKAVFYGNKNITEYESYNLGQEASMINFIVLGENLDIGYLSFRNNDKKKANFILFIQPKCEDIINDTYTIGLGGSRDIYFYEMRTKNYGDDISIDIEEYFPEMQITRDRDNKLKYTFKSINDISGDFKFPFKVYNNYFESETCTISVKVEECYKYCSSCNGTGDDSYHNCTRCKEGLSKLHFPKYDNDAIFNCCEKGVDCPNYVYEVTDGEFKICDEKCTTCENTKDNCSTCYNEKELNIFTRDIREKIKEFKNEIYYLDIDNKTCTNKLENPEKKYLDENEYRYYPCYKSCYNCNKSGDNSNHNCYSCDEINGYFHINNPNSTNCTHEKEVPINYFKNTSESVTFFQSCDENCLGCYDSNSPDQCKQCATNAYPKCVDKDANNNGPFQCFKDIPTSQYFYNKEKKCYSKCDDSCKTCDKEPETNGVKNCLSCDDLLILFNKNCVEDCPPPYKKKKKKCVLECPPYTKEEPYNNNDDEFLECLNCKDDNGKCKYLGTRYTDALGSCIDCNILEHVFPANEYYGIIDDCYELCSSCSQRGTPSKMNCDKCDTESNNPCLVDDLIIVSN